MPSPSMIAILPPEVLATYRASTVYGGIELHANSCLLLSFWGTARNSRYPCSPCRSPKRSNPKAP
jgi:hypothetical protein